MRRIALINQKGGVGKTTTAVNLGAALAREGRRVVLVDLDPQANLTVHLGVEPPPAATTYDVLVDGRPIREALLSVPNLPGLSVLGTTLDLAGAELELAGTLGRETILRDALETWIEEHRAATGEDPADYVLYDCPPSLGLLSINALAATREVFLCVQTEFFALQGMSKLVEVVGLVRRRLRLEIEITGIVACLYDSRLKLAREVLAELRGHFDERVFRQPIGSNIKLAEAPSFGQSIFDYAPDSNGARDYTALAREVIAQEQPGSESADVPLAEVELTPTAPQATGTPQTSAASQAAPAGGDAPHLGSGPTPEPGAGGPEA